MQVGGSSRLARLRVAAALGPGGWEGLVLCKVGSGRLCCRGWCGIPRPYEECSLVHYRLHNRLGGDTRRGMLGMYCSCGDVFQFCTGSGGSGVT